MRRSKLNTPGGLASVPVHPQPCELCGAWVVHGWLHVLTSSVICATCLPDPWAEEREPGLHLDAGPRATRYAGERVGKLVRELVGMA